MTTNTLTYRYAAPSALGSAAEGLFLSKFNEARTAPAPCFFWGRLVDPYPLARCLITLSRTVQSSFNLNPLQLALLKDPIVTAGDGQIRFEGFSDCAGVYARVDLREEGQDGEFLESGTTNVDFNSPLVTELARLTPKDELVLSVGAKEVGFHKDGESFIERKVPLPTKWIKGLTTVQQYFADSAPVYTLSRVQALQLFRAIPAGRVKADYYLTKRGSRFALSPVKSTNGVRIGGVHRLKLLQPLLPLVNGIDVYAHERGLASTFVLRFDRLDFVFSLSRHAARGFSGEGAALEQLLDDLPADLIDAFDQYAHTNQTFQPLAVAAEHDLDIDRVTGLAAQLAAMGLLGYDVVRHVYFHRRLPFKLSRILSLNPRLKGAEKLLADGNVSLQRRDGAIVEATVAGTGVADHYVHLDASGARCTCLWYSRHRGERGVCKHILATQKLTRNN